MARRAEAVRARRRVGRQDERDGALDNRRQFIYVIQNPCHCFSHRRIPSQSEAEAIDMPVAARGTAIGTDFFIPNARNPLKRLVLKK
jgi:hypothetical protein